MAEASFPESGIYAILNIENEKFYIGSAINFKIRWRVHINQLKRNEHDNVYLQRAYNKDGHQNFIFVILELVYDKSKLIEREQFYIDTLKPNYNIALTAGSMFGFKHSEETKKLMSLNHNRSLETSKKKSETHLGYKQTEVHIKNMVEARKGYKHSAETKAKISKANELRKRTKLSEETKAKISKARKEYWSNLKNRNVDG